MENENKNVVLVAYDFTGIGDIAIENAIQMAKLLSYKVYILHIITKTAKKKLKQTNQTLESLTDKLKKITSELNSRHNVDIDCEVKEGSLFSSISNTSKEIGANFLVFGTHGKKGIQLITGSFAMKLIKSCPVPVFVVQKPAQGAQFKEVVFPLDLDPGSKQKVKWAIAHNKQFNSRFHLFVNNFNDEYPQRRITADCNQVKKILEKHNIPYTENQAPTKGSFSANSVEFAEKINADMILIATDPDKITWNLLGSPDERLIYNQHKIPVLCINAQDLKVFIGGL